MTSRRRLRCGLTWDKGRPASAILFLSESASSAWPAEAYASMTILESGLSSSVFSTGKLPSSNDPSSSYTP